MDDPRIFDPSQPKRRRKQALSEDLWDAHRQQIEKLYLGLNMTLRDVAREMKQHGLDASVRQYTHTLERWKITKNVSAKVKRHAARKLYRNPLMSEPKCHQGGHFEHIARPVDVARFQRDNPGFDPSTSPTCSEPSVLEWPRNASKASTPAVSTPQTTAVPVTNPPAPAHSHHGCSASKQDNTHGHGHGLEPAEPTTRRLPSPPQLSPSPESSCDQETPMIFATLAVGWGWDVINELSLLRDTTHVLSSLTLAEGSALSKNTRVPALKQGLSPATVSHAHGILLDTGLGHGEPPLLLSQPAPAPTGSVFSAGASDEHPKRAQLGIDTSATANTSAQSPSTPDTVSYGPFTFQDRGWNLAPTCRCCFARLDLLSSTCRSCASPQQQQQQQQTV